MFIFYFNIHLCHTFRAKIYALKYNFRGEKNPIITARAVIIGFYNIEGKITER